MCVGGDEALLSTTKESCVGHEAESGFGYVGQWISGVRARVYVCVCACVCVHVFVLY